MASRADGPPSPTELAAWLRVASPRTARGRSIWAPSRQPERVSYSFAGRRPVMTGAPAAVEVEFWHAAPDRWRVDGPSGPLCRCDGAVAVVWSDRGVEVGRSLLVFHGPADLLHPQLPIEAGRRHGTAPAASGGTVTADELLGRRCWRWESPTSTVWVDEATGCALRVDGPTGRLELTAFETDVEIDPALFATPDDVVQAAEPAARPERRTRPPDEQRQTPAPTAPFRVVWWPYGVGSHPVAGDTAVPEVLLELHTDARPSSPQLWLGVAPAGRTPRVQPGTASRRWDGDGWSFALSWRGELSDHDLERLIASTPRAWALDGPGP